MYNYGGGKKVSNSEFVTAGAVFFYLLYKSCTFITLISSCSIRQKDVLVILDLNNTSIVPIR